MGPTLGGSDTQRDPRFSRLPADQSPPPAWVPSQPFRSFGAYCQAENVTAPLHLWTM